MPPIFKAGNRELYGSQQVIVEPGTMGQNDSWHGGASIVHVPDGTPNGRLIAAWLNWVGQPFTYYPVPVGWEGGIWTSESTDLGVTWGAPQRIIDPLTAPNMNCIAHMSYDPVRDKLLLVYYDIVYRGNQPGASVPYDGALNANRCHYRECPNVTAGGRTWSADRVLDGHTGYTSSDAGTGDGVAAPHNLIVLPNGDYLLSLYGRDNVVTSGYNTTYSRVMRSQDGGANWTALGIIASASQTLGIMNAEPAIVRLDTGRILCVMRVQNAVTGGQGAYYTNYSDDGGVTWSAPTNIGFGVYGGPNMPAIYQTVSGDVLLGTNAPSTLGIRISQSKDRGATWSTAADIVPTSGGAFLGAMFAEASPYDYDGNVMLAWCEEAQTAHGGAGLWASGNYGSGLTQGWTKFTRLTSAITNPDWNEVAEGYGNTVSSGYGDAETYTPPPASITVDPASTVWQQSGTSIIARVNPDGPAAVSAVVEHTDGGLVRFRGANASRFEISLDGATWASTATVAAGATDVFLRVTPEPEDSGATLVAEIGVPV